MSKKVTFYFLITVHLAITGYFWWETSGIRIHRGTTAVLLAFGRLSGLMLASMILLQVLHMGRARWLEGAFGLDQLARLHRRNGKWLTIFLIAHPLLLVLAYKRSSGLTFLAQFLKFQVSFEDVLNATIAACLLGFVIAYSVLMSRRKWDFEKWYWAHLSVYIAILLSFGHQNGVGTDFLGASPVLERFPDLTWFTLYWYFAYAFIFTSLAWYRFISPLKLFYTHRFSIQKLTQETPDVWSVYITGNNIEKFRYTAGQFIIVRFLARGYYWQAHPFSLSSYPNSDHIRLSIKASGDYTKTIGKLTPRTKVYIEGPYGLLTAKKSKTNKVLMVAGGIGITPFRGILEDLGKVGKNVELIYANKTESDIALRTELEELEEKYNLRVHHVLSASGVGASFSRPSSGNQAGDQGQPLQSNTTFHTGFVNNDLIKQLVPDVSTREIFLCGPPPMMSALLKTLPTLDIPKNKIYFERFSL